MNKVEIWSCNRPQGKGIYLCRANESRRFNEHLWIIHLNEDGGMFRFNVDGYLEYFGMVDDYGVGVQYAQIGGWQ